MERKKYQLPPEIKEEGIIREGSNELDFVTGTSRTTRWRLAKKGDFVKKIKISVGITGYLRREVYEWVRNRAIVK